MYRIVCTVTGDGPLTGKINDVSFEGGEKITLDDFTFELYKNVKCIKNAEMKDYISLVVRFKNTYNENVYIHYMLDYKNHEFVLNEDGHIVNANYDKLNLYDPDSGMDLWFDITSSYELSESEEYYINFHDSSLGISIEIGYCSLRNRWFEISSTLNTKDRIILRENMKIRICVNTSYLLWQMVDWSPYEIIT